MILDAGAWLGQWPFDEVEPDTTRELVARQASVGINLTSVASFEAVFRRDPMPANRRLIREVRDHPTLEPVPILNLTLAHWPDALSHYVETHRCRQVRLVPSYHLYDLRDGVVEKLVAAARTGDLKVSLQMRLEDERAHHPLMQVPPLPVEAVAALAAAHRDLTFLVLCPYRHEVLRLAEHPNLLFGISHVEALDTINRLLADGVPVGQLVLETHTPLFVTRAALAKVEQCTAGVEARRAILGGNLAAWLGGDRTRIPWFDEG